MLQVRLARLEEAFKTILECVGEDPTRNGLMETPARAAKAMLFLTKGKRVMICVLSTGIFL